ncbi:hypothetical protein SASPL_143929 [Salvia splendens]|uniref:Uncharacterized protein n=1 Tax=Salvia splendens TaxID=180675 RepID=A0A8X8WNK4_SALSN|nr:hypothetical protein SASPL_143929 [Salvia splendens]
MESEMNTIVPDTPPWRPDPVVSVKESETVVPNTLIPFEDSGTVETIKPFEDSTAVVPETVLLFYDSDMVVPKTIPPCDESDTVVQDMILPYDFSQSFLATSTKISEARDNKIKKLIIYNSERVVMEFLSIYWPGMFISPELAAAKCEQQWVSSFACDP